MVFRVTFAKDAERDFELIFEFLIDGYLGFGESVETAITRAEERAQSIRKDSEGLAKAPFRGTVHDGLLVGLRHVTLGRAVVWFEVLGEAEEVRVLAIFYGGQDHHKRMLARLLS